MTQMFRFLSSIAVWVLFITGCLCFVLSPVAHYITGEVLWLWAPLGTSFFTLVMALLTLEVVQVLE